MSPNNMNWFQAQQFCEEKGGYLAEIVTEIEQTNLNAILDTDSCYWIGLSDLAAEGEFVWQHSYSPVGGYTNWLPRQPDNGNGNLEQDCVNLWQHNWFNFDQWGWDDENCEATN